MQVNLL